MTGLLVTCGLLVLVATLLVREGWFGYPPSLFDGKVLNRKEQAFLHACSATLFPTGHQLPSGDEAEVLRYFDNMLVQLPRRQRFLIRCLFLLIEHSPILFGPVRKRVTRQSDLQRLDTFRAWEGSRFYLRRTSFLSLRTLLTLAYFGHPSVADVVAPAVSS